MKNKKYYVYIHLFPNGKRYVGLTKTDLNQRWANGRGYCTQKLMYRAILKWGGKNIKHFVYEVETESEMKYLEKYLIAYYQSNNPKYGYNISSGGDGGSGVPRTTRKPIDQYDKQKHLVRTWDSIYSAAQTLNYDGGTISACVNKKHSMAFGFYWVVSGELPEFKTYKTHRKVYQYDLEGNFIAEFKNALEAGKSLGKDNSSIVRCCNKQQKTAHNFIGRYENDNLS